MTTSSAAIRVQLKTWAGPQCLRVRLSAGLGLLEAVCVCAFAWGLSGIVSALWNRPPSVPAVLPWLGILAASLAVRAGLTLLVRKLDLSTARGVIAAVRRQVMSKALDGRVADPSQLGSLFEDSEALEGYYARFAQASFQATIVPLLLTLVIAWQSPISAGIVALTLLPFVAMMAIVGLTSAGEASKQFDALARLSNLFSDRIRALPLVLAYDDASSQAKAVGRAAREVASRTLSILKYAFLSSAVLEFFAALSVALVAVYCGFYLLGKLPFAVPEHLTLARALFILALAPEVYAPIRRLSAAYHDKQSAIAAAERMMALIIIPAETRAARLPAAPVIRYDGVVCGFNDDADFHIGPVSFAARPDTVTALTGPTGSGKTSLLRLLTGQGRLTAGHITVDNQPLDDLSASVAWVSQHPPILTGTLRENLCFGNREATDGDIARAVAATGLDTVVRRRGLDQRLNERGSGLSGGERKRIGLARALLRDAPVLVLDEPTADLDEDAEAELLEQLPGVFAGRTVILSTHSPRLAALATQKVQLA